ncbi:LMBR1 domain-containing protein 2 [Wickerhamiella sorbophila]|uniref:LMBR1 domain-containing protein 2 n=1 Tax=Wickerhamiella sorbophila TaxID=45607 RepID=A0A2T0FPT2_9ASCO|nr:LMBR1 domain-containing protein 2 [Wickerhamiella sorbophila]PRT56969.1 LMBR1 domain-containing protein 2 [Wickerhamiella sorbophila]
MLLAILAFTLIGVLAVALLSVFTRIKQLPLYLLLPLVLSIYIPLSIVVLVPIDLANNDGSGLGDGGKLIMWRIIYWLSFVLTWAVLPVLQFYVQSGHYDPIQRLKDALRANLKYQIILIATGVVGLLYMGLSIGLNFTNLKALAVALSYSYALVLAIWMLGHGLVNIPRNAWNDNPSHRLRYLYMHATATCDAYAEAQSDYDDAVAKIMALIPIKTAKYEEWIDELVEDIRRQSLPLSRSTARTPAVAYVTEEYLAGLARRFYKTLHRAIRARADWSKLVHDSAFYEDLQTSEQTGNLEFRLYSTRLPAQLANLYYISLRTPTTKVLAVFLALLSLSLAWSEGVAGSKLSLVDLMVQGANSFGSVLIAAIILGYMCWAAFSALYCLRVFNIYGLVHHDSDPSSLLFYAMYACRLAVPLSYNFLIMNTARPTVFEHFLGQYINLTPLGKYFSLLLPRFIYLPMVLTLFHFYDKIKGYLGFGIDAFDVDSLTTSTEAEGKDLINRALNDSRFKWGMNTAQLS